MFGTLSGKLSDLFDRNFTVGHLLPAVTWSAATLALAEAYDLVRVSDLFATEGGYPLLVKMLVPVAVWLLAVTSQAFNIEILQWREGYPLARSLERRIWGPLEWVRRAVVARLVTRQRRRRQRLLDRIESARREGDTGALETAWCTFAVAFPGAGGDPLPFAFGNAVRAFEVYPKALYGFEATRGWSRILMVLPQERRALVETSKAEVDMGAGLWLASWAFLAEYLLLGAVAGRLAHPVYPVCGLVSVYLSAAWSVRAAVRWGEMVKAAFDVHLPELRRALDLAPPRTRAEEREMWDRFSRAFLTRSHDDLPDMNGASGPSPHERRPSRFPPAARVPPVGGAEGGARRPRGTATR